ncbi:MAG TPA: hypothetical protein VGG23_00045, partial [Acidimicrobiales bacterium]
MPVPDGIDADRVPAHVAWALSHDDRVGRAGVGRTGVGRAGVGRADDGPATVADGRTALLEVVDGALALGVSWLTVYAVSA